MHETSRGYMEDRIATVEAIQRLFRRFSKFPGFAVLYDKLWRIGL